MSNPEKWILKDILTLNLLKGLNFPLIKSIVEKYSSLEVVRTAIEKDNLLQKLNQSEIFGDRLKISEEEAQKQIDTCERKGYKIISFWDDEYPDLLKEITYPPIVLYVNGNLQSNITMSISVVGTRKCTEYGKLTTEKFVSSFARNGIIVTSGMAYGIDTVAHLSAIKSNGITYAVLGSALDCINSEHSEKIAAKIVESGGAIISEYKCGTQALPAYFPQRNRIISGISKATLVVESARKGGALITAKFAFDQGRQVFAVPGNINSERSKGTNWLLKKDMAVPAISPDELFLDLGLNFNESIINKNTEIKLEDPELQTIYNNLSGEPIHIDALAVICKLEMAQLLVKLLDLEFRNLIKQLPGKFYIKC